jgi:hypothetical protein
MTSQNELAQPIGKRGMLKVSGTELKFAVLILDTRNRYGHTDYLCQPILGEGTQWHQSDSVTDVIDIGIDKTN